MLMIYRLICGGGCNAFVIVKNEMPLCVNPLAYTQEGRSLYIGRGGALGLGWADMQERLVHRGLICRIL